MHAEEEELDNGFFETIRIPSINKETIINLATARVKEVRGQCKQLHLTVSDLRQSNIDLRASNTELRSTIVELRQSIEQTTKQSTETINQLQTELLALNESMQEVENQLVSKKSRTVPPNPPTVALSAMINHDNNTTVSTQQPTTTTTALITSKPNIKASPPEPFSGEKIRLVGDWLAAVRRYLSLSGVEETKWVAYAVTMLTSIALSWWNSVESSNPDKSTLDYNWIEFTVLVRERFVPADSEAVAMSRMSQWKQTGSVASYINQFQNFDQLIPSQRLDEEMRVQMFMQGLKPECRLIVNVWEPKTLQQVYKMALKFDNIQRQSLPIHSQFNSYHVNRNRTSSQQTGTKHDPITIYNTVLQKEDQSAVSEEGEDDKELNQMSSQRGVCFYCQSPDHYRYNCPKLKAKDQFQLQARSSLARKNQSTPYSKN